MPIHDLGYREWQGQTIPRWTVWWVLATSGFARAWKGRWVRRLLYLAWLPAAYLGIGIFFFEKSVEAPAWERQLRGFLQSLPATNALGDMFRTGNSGLMAENLRDVRYQVWSTILMTLFRYPQGVVMVLLVALIAPPLISSDLRSRAYLLYFSRPLTVWEYLLGRGGAIAAFLIMITTGPALGLYLMGVLLSSDLQVLRYTWDLPLRILAASAVLIVPTTMLAMGICSLFTENRNAIAAWCSVWILGWVVYGNLAGMSVATDPSIPLDSWSLVSLYHVLGNVQGFVFGIESNMRLVGGCMSILLILTLVSCGVVYRKIAAPIRI